MSEKSAAEKAHLKPGTTIAVLNSIPGVIGSLGLPVDSPFVPAAEAQLVLLFVNSMEELATLMPPAVAALGPTASIWVFYRKGSRSAGLEMDRNDVWTAAERLGLRPLGLLSIDETWSAFRLRPSR